MNSSSILSFWKNNSGKRCTEADGAFRASLFNLNAARRPARFAPACPQNQRTRFSSANSGDAQNSKTHPTRRRSPPARQRLNQSGGAHRDRRQARPLQRSPTGRAAPIKFGTAGRPAHFGGARRPGSAPVKRCPKVKFKLTIQSENLRLNSKCFYHYKAD